jgi:ADP-ribose pyrophosphatase YjhB (NUDIX family)
MSTARPTVAVGAIVFDAAGRVLLVRRGKPPGVGLWTVPGGRVELGEALTAAVEREVLEETGVRVTCGALVEVVERITTEGDATWHYVILDYLAHADPQAATATHGDDAADARWFAIDELDAAPLTEGLLPVIDKARRAAGDAG